jgi:CRP-like cAMP-binding protein
LEKGPLNRRRNALLEHLPASDFALIEPLLEPVELSFRKQLKFANRRIETVYFLESGLASVVTKASGREAEAAMIGWEGFVGLPILFGADRSPAEAFMQAEGQGHCVRATAFRDLLRHSPELLRICLLFAHTNTLQSYYTGLANGKGKLEERLARWLLMAQDRLASPDIVLTHEYLGLMLGVRRAGVSIAVENFVDRGLASAARGMIRILDRDGLIEIAGGFYGAPEAEYERVFNRATGVMSAGRVVAHIT